MVWAVGIGREPVAQCNRRSWVIGRPDKTLPVAVRGIKCIPRKLNWLSIATAVAALQTPLAPRLDAGLFKIDFGRTENLREIVDAEGNATGTFPDPLTDWDIIGTWTFADPSMEEGKGIANVDGTAVTWKLKDFSKDADNDVTLTIMDNKSLAEQLNPEVPPYALGMTANNPTKEGLKAVYDGVVVPSVVKDDYLYRNPDTAGSEMLFRFANLNPGTYNVTVFEGRTTDSNGRFGKVWVDDIKGLKAPATQNTGNYSGVNLDVGGVATPVGQPRTVTVTLKAGEYLWFAEMEDNSGGISGMIIRGVGAATPSVGVLASAAVTGPYTAATDAQVDAAAKTIKVSATGSSRFFRVQGSPKIMSTSLAAGVVTIKYE